MLLVLAGMSAKKKTNAPIVAVSLTYDGYDRNRLWLNIENVSKEPLDDLLVTVDFTTDQYKTPRTIDEDGFKKQRTYFVTQMIPLGTEEYTSATGGRGGRTVGEDASRLMPGDNAAMLLSIYYFTTGVEIKYVNWRNLSDLSVYRVHSTTNHPLPTFTAFSNSSGVQGFNPLSDKWPDNVVVEKVPFWIKSVAPYPIGYGH